MAKNAKNGTSEEHLDLAPKVSIHTQRDFVSDMGWVPPGHIFSSECVRMRIACMCNVHMYPLFAKPPSKINSFFRVDNPTSTTDLSPITLGSPN